MKIHRGGKMKIMVLPGTVWQVPLMKRIKSMGHELYVTNPVKIAEVYEVADYFFQSDIFAYDAIVSYCINEKIDVVMSDECDIATDAIARYNRAIGANCITEEMAALFTNKYLMREFCQKKDINPIPHTLCQNSEEACAFFKQYGPKLIMKPLDSNASHGVFTICCEEDIKVNFEETLYFSRNEKAVLFTQRNERYDYDLLRRTNDELINATGLPFGLTHVEYKYMDGKYYLIEMAARGGGNLISAIIAPFMSGIDNYEFLIRRTLDKNYVLNKNVDINNDRIAILKFLDLPCKGGIVKAIHGEDFLSKEERIKSYKLNFRVGDYIHQPENDSVRIGYYIICAESKNEFDKITRAINEHLIIEVEEKSDGKDEYH